VGIYQETLWISVLEINNEGQDCKIGTVCAGILVNGGLKWRRLMWENMVDGLHIFIWNRTKKPLAITLSGASRELRGRDGGWDRTKAQYKPFWKCHSESPMYNKYILVIKHC
jgi:hypothetical protein